MMVGLPVQLLNSTTWDSPCQSPRVGHEFGRETAPLKWLVPCAFRRSERFGWETGSHACSGAQIQFVRQTRASKTLHRSLAIITVISLYCVKGRNTARRHACQGPTHPRLLRMSRRNSSSQSLAECCHFLPQRAFANNEAALPAGALTVPRPARSRANSLNRCPLGNGLASS